VQEQMEKQKVLRAKQMYCFLLCAEKDKKWNVSCIPKANPFSLLIPSKG
jgi:hypothetical protein